MKETGLKRGQPITFRIPSDTSDRILKQLQHLKDVERRNFSSKIAEFVIDGVTDSLVKHREAITVPLPKGLTKAQRDWLKHEHSEALLGSIVYQLMSDPIRTSALFASLNSNSLEAEDTLYLQDETSIEDFETKQQIESKTEQVNSSAMTRNIDDDLDNFDWESFKTSSEPAEIEEEESNPLGDFLAQMNK
ncbi:hypothetical protein [Sporosarcina pasteurii]|uniref:Uncharacterized protein n=1 Tax=Sporosarcina pasteurii TaxID=1474 RepID=A0A380CLK3_SPOPA|nr:hypothetical protein [Sporosarcina pasteurii]MDS9471881.1 hypothetical protein [Sporosarcina pasteurii]QBQ06618.1 hypothetical protein E2C16_13640 [Sporosarcina pasteurii]SUJ21983.1 Uncharacterised protein [Sporosarcina pasteurii]